MNINKTLFDVVQPYLSKYDCSSDELEPFLTTRLPFLERQMAAIQIIEAIMTMHGKKALLSHLAELARVEYGIGQLEPWVRDHVVHALLSFILGIYVNEEFLRPQGSRVDAFQWQLAGLFHDVGYPVQIAKDILKPFTETINGIKRKLNLQTSDIRFRVVPVGLDRLQNGRNSFGLIQKCLDTWGLQINARKEYESMMTSAEICHGIISSLTVLYVVDLMYQKHNPKRGYIDVYTDNINWNQIYFDRDVVAACAAIYIHNLPTRCFRYGKIDSGRAPVAFLLKLVDCLQEWERPSRVDPYGLSASQFDISIDDGKLTLLAEMPDSTKSGIATQIALCLANPHTRVQ